MLIVILNLHFPNFTAAVTKLMFDKMYTFYIFTLFKATSIMSRKPIEVL